MAYSSITYMLLLLLGKVDSKASCRDLVLKNWSNVIKTVA